LEKKAKVFLVEDDQTLIRVETLWIEDPGHKVVLIAHSRKEALGMVKDAKKAGVDIAVVDGNLGTGVNDGPEVAKALEKEIPNIGIISFSGEIVDWGHQNPRKPADIAQLGKIVTKVLQ